MKGITVILTLVAGTALVAWQSPIRSLDAQLRHVFPAAASFSTKEGNPPHFKAYAADKSIVGYAWWTTELEPLERGYDGPIKFMVGMDTSGTITGVLLVEHREPYGDFSVEPPTFPKQFLGKSVRSPFRVGVEVDAVARATITMRSATRAIRNSSRRIARQYLSPGAVK